MEDLPQQITLDELDHALCPDTVALNTSEGSRLRTRIFACATE
jgi:hypothetical protein